MPIINRLADFHDDMRRWRRHLHQHPELAYEEVGTAAFVAEKLGEFGVDEVHTGIARTGVVGVIKGRPGSGAIGLRADMDALPIHEETGAAWASTVPGKMHACGHDGHTTMLLGAARYLAETRNFAGTVYLIFQPAEEGHAGGRLMVEEGLFDRFPAERVFGMHNWPTLPVGGFAMCAGPSMASAAQLDIVIKGVGTHAAMPNLGRDPIVAASAFVQSVQSIVSRGLDPLDQAVVSITRIEGGTGYGIVPETVSMRGTVRTFREATEDWVERRLNDILAGIAQAHGVTGTLEFRRTYPATVNHAAEAAMGADTAAEIAGETAVDRAPAPSMGAEDFSFMLQERPGAYVWLGNGGAAEGRILHSPHYDFNDDALPWGATYWARLAERLLPAG